MTISAIRITSINSLRIIALRNNFLPPSSEYIDFPVFEVNRNLRKPYTYIIIKPPTNEFSLFIQRPRTEYSRKFHSFRLFVYKYIDIFDSPLQYNMALHIYHRAFRFIDILRCAKNSARILNKDDPHCICIIAESCSGEFKFSLSCKHFRYSPDVCTRLRL